MGRKEELQLSTQDSALITLSLITQHSARAKRPATANSTLSLSHSLPHSARAKRPASANSTHYFLSTVIN
ncbi:hypothetical protein [Nostoc sp. TCL26-01]|uniref:hypothetical protein n=1 Tax=Nostoc sp. TCL26-01 TaxID=2576904 RepID=UPI0015BBE5CA|nr:hypothetical protein [Nostoc sp. TCL26-01]